jgi:hypothetical protein
MLPAINIILVAFRLAITRGQILFEPNSITHASLADQILSCYRQSQRCCVLRVRVLFLNPTKHYVGQRM